MTILTDEWSETKINESHKQMNISTIISLISFTVFCIGGTTRFYINMLHKAFPKDKIYVDPEKEEGDESEFIEHKKSSSDSESEDVTA